MLSMRVNTGQWAHKGAWTTLANGPGQAALAGSETRVY